MTGITHHKTTSSAVASSAPSSIRGQAALSFMVSLPAVILISLLGAVSISLVTAKVTLHADRYYVARAHLYGNSPNECGLANFWPQTLIEAMSTECIGPYISRASIHFGRVLGYPIYIQSEISTFFREEESQ